MTTPRVSIIMAVLNAQTTLEAALASIAAQTFTDWEFVICDDGSSDETAEILASFRSTLGAERVTVLTNPVNRKLAYSLNRCLDAARGEFIARMDGDDLSEPDRLEKQLAYLDDHADVDLVGTAMRRFNGGGLGEVVQPAAEAPDRWVLARASGAPFFHATVLARRAVFDAVGNYTVSWRTERCEDLDLWYKFFAAGLRGRNLSEPLYRVREDAAAIRRRRPWGRLGSFATSFKGAWMLGYPPSAYIRELANLMKIFVPYRVFDLHRAWTQSRASRHDRPNRESR
ncbi:glycosyltransferase family 2 protein [Tessaracoccus flavus]|uniref:Uncharacterized protein n=2 Tax=Tessaracoccus flavus TaxID=1610493 RepID=A0A1Q2CI05_9ACTN|nr:glycosyltransferase family A protein [Tessaracoccus flavus]AQP45756.1 hypothetical protein RPIT_13855 [Tessaracoccus flavus]SDZ12122.1 glycosyltransferase EpsE [Tessaracoccus flavus]